MGVVARVVMDKWEKKIREALSKNQVQLYLIGKYVDDVNLATSLIARGYGLTETLEGRRLICTREKEVSDIEEGRSDNERTLDLIKEEANKLVPGLRFTVDCQEKNSDGHCPMLDLK